MASARDGRAVRDRMAARVREVRRMYFFKRQNSFAVEWVSGVFAAKASVAERKKNIREKRNSEKQETGA